MRILKMFIIPLILLLILNISCPNELLAQDKTPFNYNVQDTSDVPAFIYPMHIGNIWVYGWYDGFTYTPNQRWEVMDNSQEGDAGQCAMIQRVASSTLLEFDVEEFNLCMFDNTLFFRKDQYQRSAPDTGYYPIVDFSKERGDMWIVRDLKSEEGHEGVPYYSSRMTHKLIDSTNEGFEVRIESYYALENLEPAYSKISSTSSFESGMGITRLDDYVMIGAVIEGVVIGDTAFVYTTSIEGIPSEIPNKIEITTYPNPFNPSVTIQFTVPNEESVSMRVFNSLGQVVETLWVNQSISAGTHTQVWSPAEHLSSGVYFVRLEGKDFVETQKVTLQK